MSLFDNELSTSEIIELAGGVDALEASELRYQTTQRFSAYGSDAVFFAEVRRQRLDQEVTLIDSSEGLDTK